MRRHLFVAAAACAALVAAIALAGSPVERAKQRRGVLTPDSVSRSEVGVINQTYTNDISDTTLYTPDYVGQVLVETGTTDDGTNNAWIAVGLTTNDWTTLR